MKIENLPKKRLPHKITEKQGTLKQVTPGTDTSFLSKFLTAQKQTIREELETLMGEIDSQALIIEKTLTFNSLECYKDLVRKFVQIAVNELYEVEEKLSITPSGKHKALTIVKKIDETLEKLASEFLSKHGNLIDFIARLDQIRGLLLDLYT